MPEPEITGPEIAGPGAEGIQVQTGAATPNEVVQEIPPQLKKFLGGLAAAVQEQAEAESKVDPSFPFGKPEDIDYSTLDSAGITMIQELNKRPWIKTVEYCSGHPLDRPTGEQSELYPYATGENVYVENAKLDMAFVRGLVPDQYYRHRKEELRKAGMTRFFLNVNVENLVPFMEWVTYISKIITIATNTIINPVIVRYNPLRPGVNFSVYWDYWTLEERQLIHSAVMDALQHVTA
jgi:hypothetical protein